MKSDSNKVFAVKNWGTFGERFQGKKKTTIYCAVKWRFVHNILWFLVEVTRLELATSRSLTVRATRLRHTSTYLLMRSDQAGSYAESRSNAIGSSS